MCSVGDDNLEDLENLKYMPPKEKIPPNSKCNKCREATPVIVLRSKDKYCKECFLAGTVHKFKALLGKHKLIRPDDRVLIVHKCGHASTALLHFIRTGLDLGTHKKLRFEPYILFIEDHSHLSLREREELVQKVEEEMTHFKFPIYFSSMKHLIKKGVTKSSIFGSSELMQLHESDKTVLDEYVTEQSNETNKNDYLNVVRQKYLIEIAKYLNCKFIFIPDLSNDVASQLLTDISLGRGSNISLNTGFCDYRDDVVKILRPLRLFEIKELTFYNHLNNLEPVTYRIRVDNPYKSVQQLMKKFVNDLQENYPATVTTILRTGDKLTLSNQTTTKCEFCNAPVGEEALELNSAEATQFSHWISTRASTSSDYATALQAFRELTCNNYCFSCKRLFK